MAKQYIERDGALDAISKTFKWTGGEKQYHENVIRIMNIPAANVKPVVHGQWIGVYNDLTCSVCNKRWDEWRTGAADDWGYWEKNPSFCPNCGADMRETEE